MRILRVEINDSIYEHILFFLKSLPSNLINISYENESRNKQTEKSMKNQIQELFSAQKIKIFQDIKDPIAWQKGMRDEWE